MINSLSDPINKTYQILADKGNKPTQDREEIKQHIKDIRSKVKRVEENIGTMGFEVSQIKTNTKELVSNIHTVREAVRNKLTPVGDYSRNWYTRTTTATDKIYILKQVNIPVATDNVDAAIDVIVDKLNITRNIPLDAFLTSTIVGQRTDVIDDLISGGIFTELDYIAANANPRKLSTVVRFLLKTIKDKRASRFIPGLIQNATVC